MDLSRFRSIRAANVQQGPFFGISKFRQQSAFFTQKEAIRARDTSEKPEAIGQVVCISHVVPRQVYLPWVFHCVCSSQC